MDWKPLNVLIRPDVKLSARKGRSDAVMKSRSSMRRQRFE
jgi:hypothetical protein